MTNDTKAKGSGINRWCSPKERFVPMTPAGSLCMDLASPSVDEAWKKLMIAGSHMPYRNLAEWKQRGYTIRDAWTWKEKERGMTNDTKALVERLRLYIPDHREPDVQDLDCQDAAATIERLEHGAATALKLVAAQAQDECLWFVAERATEAYLQRALRDLHAAVEGTWP